MEIYLLGYHATDNRVNNIQYLCLYLATYMKTFSPFAISWSTLEVFVLEVEI